MAALLLVGTLGLSIFTSRRFAASSDRVDHTMVVQVTVARLYGTLLQAEAGQRGYLLTGRRDYLEPYSRARLALTERVDKLHALTVRNPAVQSLVAAIAKLTAVRLDELQQGIDRRDRDGLMAAQAAMDTDLGLHTMDALRADLDATIAIEDARLAQHLAGQQRYESLTRVSLVLSSLLFGLSAGLVLLRNRTVAERQRTAQFQERFMAILGHDLRNPLSSLTMGVDLLRRIASSTQQITMLERMGSTAARMSRMIDQLLDLTRSRLGAGIAVCPVPTNLGKVVTEVSDEVHAAHPQRALRVELTGDLDGEWDPDRVAQVVSNLVGNAIDHGAPDGTVRVTARGDHGVAQILVHNPGPAIPEDLLPVLFDPFRRGQETGPTSRSSGLGLGLYITREIVAGHGGTIEVASTDAEGTTFQVRLPRSRDPRGATPSRP
ncbi:MAG TPA: CHASE3 domain-containing protein [Polyangiaceae bacterium]|jgi:signal transduction histidine kinase